jgi:hypothetical protein
MASQVEWIFVHLKFRTAGAYTLTIFSLINFYSASGPYLGGKNFNQAYAKSLRSYGLGGKLSFFSDPPPVSMTFRVEVRSADGVVVRTFEPLRGGARAQLVNLLYWRPEILTNNPQVNQSLCERFAKQLARGPGESVFILRQPEALRTLQNFSTYSPQIEPPQVLGSC